MRNYIHLFMSNYAIN